MGRYAHQSFLHEMSEEDEEICRWAIKEVGLEGMEERSFLSLSGGEKQRTYMAAAFAQKSPIIILDEPTNHLDIAHQIKVMQTLRAMKDVTVLTSVHDINLAAWFCDEIVVLYEGSIVAIGPPKEALTKEIIRQVFHVDARVTYSEEDEFLQVQFLPGSR